MKKPDPRIMLLISACFSTMGVLIGTVWLLAIVFGCAVLYSLALGAELFMIVKKLKRLLSVIFVIALLESVFNGSGDSIIKIGEMDVLTTGGLLKGTNTLLRMGTVIVSASIFTLTTSRRMIQGLIQLKIPYEFAFMTFIALRFLPVFTEEFTDTITAIQLRGINLKKIPLKQKLKIYIYILTPVVYGAVDKAQKLSYAMELRAFRLYNKRTSRFTLKLKTGDYTYIVIMPIITICIMAYYYLYI